VPPAPNKLLEGPILRSLLTLAVPIVAANVLQSAYQIIDAFWVGRLGGAAVAAVSISFPVLFLTFAIGSGLSLAGSTLIAQYVGARNDKMVAHVAGQTLLMVILASVVLGTIGYLCSPGLLRLMGVGPETSIPGRWASCAYRSWASSSISPSSCSRRSCAASAGRPCRSTSCWARYS
jgi:Na+-driven multidrug efflux pump